MKSLSYVHAGGERPLIGQPIHSYLSEVAAQHAESEAVVSIPQACRLSYTDLFEQVEQLSLGLLALGVEKGDRVGVWATDNVEWIVLQIASARVGAVLVNINPANKAAEFEHAMRAARVGTLFLMPAFKSSHYVDIALELCPEARTRQPEELVCERLPELRNLVVFDPLTSEPRRPGTGFLLWHEVMELGETIPKADLTERESTLEMDDPINIQFTSGTTGFPKPVVLSHHNILHNAYWIGRQLKLTSEDRVCVPVPFYHCFGMVISNLACLARGAAIVIPSEHFDSGATLAAVDHERCTVLHGVPTMFVAELARDDFGDYD
ncbi:MAG: AMP-binding protein, partial [Deltaproteobacteria bacterium]|nr:AMP-binding protein [Deltaproteobacteria bacterium]